MGDQYVMPQPVPSVDRLGGFDYPGGRQEMQAGLVGAAIGGVIGYAVAGVGGGILGGLAGMFLGSIGASDL